MDGFNPIESLIQNSRIYDHNAEVVVRFVLSYYQELGQLEKTQARLNCAKLSRECLNAEILKQQEIHDKYWKLTTDDYWRPCSLGNFEAYQPESIEDISTLADGRGSFVISLTFKPSTKLHNKKLSYLVETVEQKPRIANKFF